MALTGVLRQLYRRVIQAFDPVSVPRRRFMATAASIAATPLSFFSSLPEQAVPGSPSKYSTPTKDIELSINGKSHRLRVECRTTLLDVLRENLNMHGTKKGCDRGQCGACTVLANGRRINSCLALAVMQQGVKITTIEGIAAAGLGDIQKKFVERDAFQCGYCTPGQICSTAALLEEHRSGSISAASKSIASSETITLSEAEIRERMSGNICRCGAYPNIVQAIRELAGGTA